uniref:Secreted protein n=1 Tax=Trichobilharzia regenti TaxID=157069 RepID=A0AA85IVJ6_TRIRE|nr:unnamed protein product [Trichobilharzia regenti]
MRNLFWNSWCILCMAIIRIMLTEVFSSPQTCKNCTTLSTEFDVYVPTTGMATEEGTYSWLEYLFNSIYTLMDFPLL